MPIRVQVGGKIVEFPDGTTEDVMRKALSTLTSDPAPTSLDMASGRVGRDTGGEKEPDTWMGGFIKGLRQNFVDPLTSSDIAKHAAHPETAADMAGLLIPSAIGMGSAKEFIPAAKKLYEGAAKGAAEREGLKKIPAVIKGMWGATKRTPDQVIANFERKIFSEGHVAPDVTSVPDRGLPMEEMPQSVSSQVDRYKPNVGSTPDRGIPQGEMPRPSESGVDPHLPNKSGYVPGSASRNTTLRVGEGPTPDRYMPNSSGVPDRGLPQGEMIGPAESEVDRYLPNRSGTPDAGVAQGDMPSATPPPDIESALDTLLRKSKGADVQAPPVQTDRIPYATPTARPSTSGFGKVVGKAPTLDEVLQDALEGTKAADPTEVSTLAETPMTGGAQKPKVGKRPGGYTTDIPARGKAVEGEGAVAPEGVTRSPADRRAGTGKIDKLSETSQGADQLEQLLSALHPDEAIPRINPEGHGSMAAPSGFQETMRSTEPEMVEHFGAEPGTPEAASAQAHHKMAGEMDADYRRRINDPLASFLLTALTGGGLASRQTTSNQGSLQ